MKEQSPARYNLIFWIAFAFYAIAYFLPSYATGQTETMLGMVCAYFSVILLFSEPSLLFFIGNLANLSVLILLFMRLPIFPPKTNFTAFAIVLIVMAVLGTLAWVIVVEGQGLRIGYFVWTLATITMAVSFLLYRRALREQALNKELEDSCPADHLIADND